MAHADWSLSPVLGAPKPPPRLVYRLDGGIVGAIWVMGRVNRALVQRTAGLLERARRELPRGRGNAGARENRDGDPACYGPSFTYTEMMPTGGVVSAFLISVGIMVTLAALVFIAPVRVFCFVFFADWLSDRIRIDRSSPFSQLRWLFKRLVTQPGSGPADQYVADRFFLTSLLYGCTS
jgi:hypothetical protein